MSIKPLNIKNKLKPAPTMEPKYSVELKDGAHTLKVADPKATRSSLALMNLAAVNGGAACHWGGPSALVEIMSVVHAKMFQNTQWFNDFNFVNDIGHAENGIYALRSILGYDDLSLDSLMGFRSINSSSQDTVRVT